MAQRHKCEGTSGAKGSYFCNYIVLQHQIKVLLHRKKTFQSFGVRFKTSAILSNITKQVKQ